MDVTRVSDCHRGAALTSRAAAGISFKRKLLRQRGQTADEVVFDGWQPCAARSCADCAFAIDRPPISGGDGPPSCFQVLMKQSASKAAPKVGIVSLGCPKALVDSERILTKLRAEGYVVSD